jgi:hypothetical protein
VALGAPAATLSQSNSEGWWGIAYGSSAATLENAPTMTRAVRAG